MVDEGITRSALVAQCADLMRAAFELKGIGLHVDDDLGSSADEPEWPQGAALRYMFLGALGYLHDSASNLGAVRVGADGEGALRLVATPGGPGTGDPLASAHRAPRKLAIDAVALQALVDDLGYTAAVERDSVRFVLASG